MLRVFRLPLKPALVVECQLGAIAFKPMCPNSGISKVNSRFCSNPGSSQLNQDFYPGKFTTHQVKSWCGFNPELSQFNRVFSKPSPSCVSTLWQWVHNSILRPSVNHTHSADVDIDTNTHSASSGTSSAETCGESSPGLLLPRNCHNLTRISTPGELSRVYFYPGTVTIYPGFPPQVSYLGSTSTPELSQLNQDFHPR